MATVGRRKTAFTQFLPSRGRENKEALRLQFTHSPHGGAGILVSLSTSVIAGFPAVKFESTPTQLFYSKTLLLIEHH